MGRNPVRRMVGGISRAIRGARNSRPTPEEPEGLPAVELEPAPRFVLDLLVSAPPVSVVIPAFNAPAELRACLESVVRNTGTATEVVVIDDASTDPGVGSVLAHFRDEYGIRVLSNASNLGFVATANRGFEAVSGDVILLNSDTRVPPRWVERLRLAAYSHVLCCHRHSSHQCRGGLLCSSYAGPQRSSAELGWRPHRSGGRPIGGPGACRDSNRQWLLYVCQACRARGRGFLRCGQLPQGLRGGERLLDAGPSAWMATPRRCLDLRAAHQVGQLRARTGGAVAKGNAGHGPAASELPAGSGGIPPIRGDEDGSKPSRRGILSDLRPFVRSAESAVRSPRLRRWYPTDNEGPGRGNLTGLGASSPQVNGQSPHRERPRGFQNRGNTTIEPNQVRARVQRRVSRCGHATADPVRHRTCAYPAPSQALSRSALRGRHTQHSNRSLPA